MQISKFERIAIVDEANRVKSKSGMNVNADMQETLNVGKKMPDCRKSEICIE